MKSENKTDPLKNPAFKEPGVLGLIKELFSGGPRVFDVIQVEVTSQCPSLCSYCPHSTKQDIWKKRHMSDEVFAGLWPMLRQSRRVHLQGWGEPFLHPRFFDFVAFARKAGCQVSTTTCGLFMTEEYAVRLVKSGVDIVAFSLAGSDAESNAVRHGSDFYKVIESIHLLQAVRKKLMGVHMEVHLAYLVLASQVNSLKDLPALMNELDVHAAVVSTMDYIPSLALESEAYMPWEQEKIAVARKLLEEVSAAAQENGREVFYSLPMPEPRNTCLEHIERSSFVDAEGHISPCIYVNLPTSEDDPLRRVYGKVGKDDPMQVWNSPEYTAFRQGLATGRPDDNCADCPKRYAVGNRE